MNPEDSFAGRDLLMCIVIPLSEALAGMSLPLSWRIVATGISRDDNEGWRVGNEERE